MSSKLVIIVAVQSALVVGIGGVALGMAMTGPAPAAHPKGKKHAPPEEAHADADHDADDEEAEPPPAKVKHSKKKSAAVDAEPEHGEASPDAKPHDDPEHTDDAHGAPKHAEAKAHGDSKAHGEADDHDEAAHGDRKKGHEAPEHEPPPAKGKRPAAHADETARPPAAASPKDSLEAFAWLDEGNTRWAQGHLKARDVVTQREQLAQRFEPWAMVVTCTDGRAAPEAVFDAGGAALVTLRWPSLKASAALLGAIDTLVKRHSLKVVVLLGHAGCVEGKGDAAAAVTGLASKVLASKVVRPPLAANQLLVLRATYDLTAGRVRWLDSEESDGPPQASAAH